jgi:hypothetical protein
MVVDITARGRRPDEIEELLLRIRGLVYATAILEERGLAPRDVEEHRQEIDRLRSRLAKLVADAA